VHKKLRIKNTEETQQIFKNHSWLEQVSTNLVCELFYMKGVSTEKMKSFDEGNTKFTRHENNVTVLSVNIPMVCASFFCCITHYSIKSRVPIHIGLGNLSPAIILHR